MWSAVAQHRARDCYPYHVPGHKAGHGLDSSFVAHIADCDLTELPGLDNLAAPTGPLAAAEALAAALVRAEATYFTTNGSTAGILAGVLALAPPGSNIILPRTAHQSFYSACVLGDLVPIFLPVELHPELALPMGYTLSSLRASLEIWRPSVVVATSPTYHGVCGDTAAITAVCREYGVPVLVDEAHGTHLLVSDTEVQSAVCSGADIVVQSVHKTGGALTGAAWVHCFTPRYREPLKRALRLVQSSSPSYPLLVSLDLARRTLATEGRARFGLSRQHADKLRALLPAVSFPAPWQQDPLRVVIDARYFNMSGFALEKAMGSYGLAPEMADAHTVTLVLGLFESDEGLRRAAALARDLPRVGRVSRVQVLPHQLDRRMPVLTPRQAYFGRRREVPLSHALGEICAEPLVPYPPGVPLLWPGQRIELEDVAYLKAHLAAGGNCVGISPTKQMLVMAGDNCE